MKVFGMLLQCFVFSRSAQIAEQRVRFTAHSGRCMDAILGTSKLSADVDGGGGVVRSTKTPQTPINATG